MARVLDPFSVVPFTLGDHAPNESWWVNANGAFYATAKQEMPRMKHSRFANIEFGNYEVELKGDRRRRLPV